MVKLPNGHEVHATHLGTVHLTPSIILNDVLYIPSFSFNLISISKLISTNNYELIFSSNTCVLQDINTKAKIGTVEVSHGLYQLTLKPSHSRIVVLLFNERSKSKLRPSSLTVILDKGPA